MKRLFIMATLAVASMAGISVMAQAPAKEGACKTECVKSKGCCQADKECPAKADCPKEKCAQGDAYESVSGRLRMQERRQGLYLCQLPEERILQ